MVKRLALLVGLFASSGCTLVAESLLRDAVTRCEGEPDGTPCVGADFCVAGACIVSACGDGFLDATRGEVCDDGNLVSGDGCEPGLCTYSCESDAQCEDANPCRATMGCNLDTHTCKPFVPTSGAICQRGTGEYGTCRMGLCAEEGCGDGVVVAPEECDDATPGCAADCRFVCETDDECVTDDVCTMPLTCDVGTHTCVDAPTPSCDDGDPCTTNACDPLLACTTTIVDADQDGFSPGTCGEGSIAMGGDCDDTSMDVRPGAPELVDGLDQDCDDVIDENPGVNCLRDADGDGYGDPTDTVFASTCPEGYVAPRVRDDCHDENPNVRPNQMNASSFPYCPPGSTLMGSASTGFSCTGGPSNQPSWDWNCDGAQTPTNNATMSCATASVCGGTGWMGSVPPCGGTGTITTCTRSCVLVLCSCDATNTPNVPQYCL